MKSYSLSLIILNFLLRAQTNSKVFYFLTNNKQQTTNNSQQPTANRLPATYNKFLELFQFKIVD